MIFTTNILGIPCQCKVLTYTPSLPMKVTNGGFGDVFPPEDEVFEYELVDELGDRINWIHKYCVDDIEAQLLDEYRTMRFAEKYAYQPEYEDAPYPS